VSFAYLVYSSSWMKLRYPAAFCAALLNVQPMGFYSPNTLVADARRHGVTVYEPDVNLRDVKATPVPTTGSGEAGRPDRDRVRAQRGRRSGQRIAERRPYASMEDLVRLTGRRCRRSRPCRRPGPHRRADRGAPLPGTDHQGHKLR